MPPQLPPETDRVAEGFNADVLQLEGFGYKQELKRGFSFFGMIGFAFSVLTCWTALAGSLTVAISAGGPPVIIYSWIGMARYSISGGVALADRAALSRCVCVWVFCGVPVC